MKRKRQPIEGPAATFRLDQKFTVTGAQLSMIIYSVNKMLEEPTGKPPHSFINTNRIMHVIANIVGLEEREPNY